MNNPLNKNINCWEFKKCGREPGGINANSEGVCPAAAEGRYSGINGGINGGRICWFVDDTRCDNGPTHTFLHKFERCQSCDFYLKVQKQQARHLVVVPAESFKIIT